MKIGIITLNGYRNYGNKLQNFALQKFLESLSCNINAETIWYTKDNYILNTKMLNTKNIRRFIFNRHEYRKYINNNIYLHDVIREYNIKKFSDKYIKTVYDYEVKKDLNERYDYFIAGSDQIWNYWYRNLDVEFLQFADKNKRISYAASFGVSEVISKYKKTIADGLKNMNFISVRENVGAKIIKDLTGKDVPVLIDPTLLISKNEWEKIKERPVWYKDEKYILTFFLGNMPEKVREYLINLSNKYKFKIVNLMDKENIDYYCSHPSEFLYLIDNATLIFTDSFHATVFSILMKKPFVVSAKDASGMNMDSRIDTLLSMFKLESRKISKDNNYEITDPMEIEYPDVEAILDRERQRSKEFLCKALHIKE